MKLTITQAHNDKAEVTMINREWSCFGICVACPTALAFCEATDRPIGSIVVGYTGITERNTRDLSAPSAPLAKLPPILTAAIRAYTCNRPRTPILGTFDIEVAK